MDIGVGTGFYLKKSADKINKITLSDLNVHSLECAKKYISDEKLNSCLCHDIFNRFTGQLRGYLIQYPYFIYYIVCRGK